MATLPVSSWRRNDGRLFVPSSDPQSFNNSPTQDLRQVLARTQYLRPSVTAFLNHGTCPRPPEAVAPRKMDPTTDFGQATHGSDTLAAASPTKSKRRAMRCMGLSPREGHVGSVYRQGADWHRGLGSHNMCCQLKADGC